MKLEPNIILNVGVLRVYASWYAEGNFHSDSRQIQKYIKNILVDLLVCENELWIQVVLSWCQRMFHKVDVEEQGIEKALDNVDHWNETAFLVENDQVR